MISELYTALTGVAGVTGAWDTKLPDEFELSGSQSVIVVSGISDVPLITVDARIALRHQRLQCEVQALTLPVARTVKEALIVALQGWSGGVIKKAMFESGGPELYDPEMIPPRYCLPVDFMIVI